MIYRTKSGAPRSAVVAAIIAVTAALFLGCGGDFRHVAGEERDFDPGETGDDFIRVGSIKKPVDARWLYRVTESNDDIIEIEITVIAVTDSSYKLRERREGYADIEYYYEDGPEMNGFTTISLYEVYTVGGERITLRYSPPQKYIPTDGYLEEGLLWRDGPISVEETTTRRREKDERDFELAAKRYSIETVGSVDTPAGEFVAATLIKSSAEGLLIEKSFVSNIGTVKRVIFDEDGSISKTWELLEFSFPERD